MLSQFFLFACLRKHKEAVKTSELWLMGFLVLIFFSVQPAES